MYTTGFAKDEKFTYKTIIVQTAQKRHHVPFKMAKISVMIVAFSWLRCFVFLSALLKFLEVCEVPLLQ